MSFNSDIEKMITESISVKNEILSDKSLMAKVNGACEAIIECYQNNKRLFTCGNGGSAADAQHIAAEFTGRFRKDRKGLPAEALHCNTSYLTSVANDYSFDLVYSRLIEANGKSGDILIAISTSGNSTNIVNAAATARENGIFVIGMTGQKGGLLGAMADILINIPSLSTPRIQESHILIGHVICEIVEDKLFSN